VTSAQGPAEGEASRRRPLILVAGAIVAVIIVAVVVLLLAGGNKTQDGPGDPKLTSTTAPTGQTTDRGVIQEH
jgi:hypothetical protein